MNRRIALVALLVVGACDSPTNGPPTLGRLQIDVLGLPVGTAAYITVRGPGGYVQLVSQATTLTSLLSGDYQLWPNSVRTDSTTHAPTDSVVVVKVGGAAPATAAIAYRLVTGRLAVLMDGLPQGTPAQVTVAGLNGFGASVKASDTLENIAPGIYEVFSGNVGTGADLYAPLSVRTPVVVSASLEPARVQVRYALISGTVSVLVNGLPPNTEASVRLSGPNGVLHTITSSRAVSGLLGGFYTLSADTVSGGNARWAPLPASQNVALATGTSATVAVNYTALDGSGGGANLTIAGVHLQQVVQTFGGAVPLIDGRDALLRVFVLGSTPGIPAPPVRVQLYHGATIVTTAVVAPPVATVPTVVDEGALSSSWNYRVPASLVRPGLAVLVEADPSNQISESSEADNTWPAGSSPWAPQVRTVAPLTVRFVPIVQAATGLVGRVAAGSLDQFLGAARKLLPLSRIDGELAPPYTTNAPAVVSSDSNQAWIQILSELNAMRAAEGGSAVYFGVLQTPYVSGIAGMAYVNGRAALGWDFLPGASIVVAHELGHSFGRFHSPCGRAGGIDVSYPYARGTIGGFGYDPVDGRLIAPTAADVMSYCSPVWISDYTFTGMLNHWLFYGGAFLASARAEPQAGLLVWGRIERGRPILESAFEITAPASLPRRTGPEQLEVMGDGGKVLARLSFEAEPVAGSGDQTAAHFAFVVPKVQLGGEKVSSIHFRTKGRVTSLLAAGRDGEVLAPARAERTREGVARISWGGGRARAALVRDASTGRVVGFVRAGGEVAAGLGIRLEVVLSDGLASQRQLVQVTRSPASRADRP